MKAGGKSHYDTEDGEKKIKKRLKQYESNSGQGEKKKIKMVEDEQDPTVANENKTETISNKPEDNDDIGAYDPNTKEWVWNLGRDLKLRVGKLNGRKFVDIRHQWQGNPTKKGAFLSIETFQKIQNWPKLEEALKLIP